jgi:hypothetical protein
VKKKVLEKKKVEKKNTRTRKKQVLKVSFLISVVVIHGT